MFRRVRPIASSMVERLQVFLMMGRSIPMAIVSAPSQIMMMEMGNTR